MIGYRSKQVFSLFQEFWQRGLPPCFHFPESVSHKKYLLCLELKQGPSLATGQQQELVYIMDNVVSLSGQCKIIIKEIDEGNNHSSVAPHLTENGVTSSSSFLASAAPSKG